MLQNNNCTHAAFYVLNTSCLHSTDHESPSAQIFSKADWSKFWKLFICNQSGFTGLGDSWYSCCCSVTNTQLSPCGYLCFFSLENFAPTSTVHLYRITGYDLNPTLTGHTVGEIGEGVKLGLCQLLPITVILSEQEHPLEQLLKLLGPLQLLLTIFVLSEQSVYN